MQKDSANAGEYYASAPYKDAFDIEYPQENLQGQMYVYRCTFCKKLTTEINGLVDNHAPDCEYRLARMKGGA
jgi:DNA-directed RNA polymerase subunit RPC12/RpoP